jgi:GAF domain-containing protein
VIKQIIEMAEEGRPDVVATEADALSAATRAVKRGKPYEVFLIDQRLGPGKDGIEVLQDLRRLSPESDAIIFTGYGDPKDGLRAYEQGAFRYISKPFPNEELLFLLKSVKQWRKETREHVWQKIFSQTMEETLHKKAFHDVAETVVKQALKLGFERAHLFWVPRYEDANLESAMIGIAAAGHGCIKQFGKPATQHMIFPMTRWFGLLATHDAIFLRPEEVNGVKAEMAEHGYKWPAGENAILPLYGSTRLLGALLLDHGTHLKSLSDHERALLNFFARQVSLALENASLYIQEKRSREEADIISTVGKQVSTLAATNDMPALVSEVRALMSKLMNTSNLALVLCNDETSELEFHRIYAETRRYEYFRMPFGSGLEGYLISHHAGLFKPSGVAEFARANNISMDEPIPAQWMGAPLVVADQVIGALTLQNFGDETKFTKRDWHLWAAVAHQIAGAIQLSRLHESEQRDTERLNVQRRAMTEMLRVAQRREEDLWLTAITVATANFGTAFNRALLFLENDEHAELGLKAAVGTEDSEKAHRDWERDEVRRYQFADFLRDLDLGQVAPTDFAQLVGTIHIPLNPPAPDALNETIRTGGVAIVKEKDLATRLPRALLEKVAMAECAVIPVRSGERIIGVMVVDNKHNHIKLKQPQLFRLQNLLGYAGLVKETLRQQAKSESLLDANYQIISGAAHETLKETLQRICETAHTFTEADWVIIYPYKESETIFDVANVGFKGEISTPLEAVIVEKPSKSGMSYFVLTNGQLVINDLSKSKMKIVKRMKATHFIRVEKVQALIGIAIKDPFTQQTLGLLYLDYRRARAFTELEIHHARSFASLAAVAISNARRFDQERQHQRLLAAQSIAEVANRVIDQDDMFRQVLDDLQELFHGAAICILTYDPDEKALRFAPATLKFYRAAGMKNAAERIFPLGGPSLACRVARESLARHKGIVINVPDISNDKDYLKVISTSQSELCVGLMDSEKELLGVLVLERDGPFGFSTEDENLIQIVALQLSQGLERIRKSDQLTFTQTVATMTAWAADIAHDIKNEVGTIKMSAYYIKEYAETREEVLDAVDEIVKSTKILAQADPQASQKKQDVLFDAIIKKHAYPLAQDRSIQLECQLNAPDCYVTVNSIAMRRILRHLTRNADRAMQNKPEKKIIIRTFQPDRDHVEMHFQDFGVGVSEKVQSALFWKTITTKTAKDSGGHGLLFTRQLVEDMDGTIRLLKSEPGKGATFAIRLPVSKVYESTETGADQ